MTSPARSPRELALRASSRPTRRSRDKLQALDWLRWFVSSAAVHLLGETKCGADPEEKGQGADVRDAMPQLRIFRAFFFSSFFLRSSQPICGSRVTGHRPAPCVSNASRDTRAPDSVLDSAAGTRATRVQTGWNRDRVLYAYVRACAELTSSPLGDSKSDSLISADQNGPSNVLGLRYHHLSKMRSFRALRIGRTRQHAFLVTQSLTETVSDADRKHLKETI